LEISKLQEKGKTCIEKGTCQLLRLKRQLSFTMSKIENYMDEGCHFFRQISMHQLSAADFLIFR